MLAHHYPDLLPPDQRLTRQLAHGVLKLAPRPRNVRWKPAPVRQSYRRGERGWKRATRVKQVRYVSRPAGASVTAYVGSRIQAALVPWFLHITKNTTSNEEGK